MKGLSPISFRPGRGMIQNASLGPVSLYLGAYLVVCFFSSDPIVMLAATAGAVLAGLGSGADRAVWFSLRLGAILAISMIVINALVTSRGATVLARLGDWPVLGRVDVTAESIAAGAIIGLRALGTMVAIGIFSACVDPDRLLRAVHGFAGRSALTATLISRLVPLAAQDLTRIGEAATLRGPGANQVGRAAMANRLLAGSLDRSIDVASTLELRGYSLTSGKTEFARIPSRYDLRFRIVGVLLMVLALLGLFLDTGSFVDYPSVLYSPGLATAVIAGAFLAGGLCTWKRGGRRNVR